MGSSTKLSDFVPWRVALSLRTELEFAFKTERNEESGTSYEGGGGGGVERTITAQQQAPI